MCCSQEVLYQASTAEYQYKRANYYRVLLAESIVALQSAAYSTGKRARQEPDLVNAVGLTIATLPPRRLLLKSPPLLRWVCQLRECVGYLEATAEDFETLYNPALDTGRHLRRAMHPSKGRDLERVICYDSGLP